MLVDSATPAPGGLPRRSYTAQVFSRGATPLIRLGILSVLLGSVLLFAGGELWVRSSYVTQVGVPVEQPVPFSHKHHVTDDGIDCRYCHTSVENAAFAGIPPTATCMNCHSQIWAQSPVLEPVRQSFATGQPLQWNRVTSLPDYVYFDHSIHIQKGIGCSSCHGQVDQMPLTFKTASMQMSFCMACHENPEQFVRPKDQVFNMQWQPPANQAEMGRQLVADYHIQTRISCDTCHR